ncbi:MAG: hypothetical protein ACI3ZD_17895 [Prevotella sp.]
MKKALFISALILFGFSLGFAQTSDKPFKGRFENDEYKVYLVLNLYNQNVKVPGQDLYGELPGYLGKRNNSFCWLITGAKVKSSAKATINLINEYGSEDLEATLTLQGDSLLTLKQGEGSDIKVPNKGKWQKLPSTLIFKRKK